MATESQQEIAVEQSITLALITRLRTLRQIGWPAHRGIAAVPDLGWQALQCGQPHYVRGLITEGVQAGWRATVFLARPEADMRL